MREALVHESAARRPFTGSSKVTVTDGFAPPDPGSKMAPRTDGPVANPVRRIMSDGEKTGAPMVAAASITSGSA